LIQDQQDCLSMMSNERLLSLRDRAAEILLKLHALWTAPRTRETSVREQELGAELSRVTEATHAEFPSRTPGEASREK
jgi:hypothetical protein